MGFELMRKRILIILLVVAVPLYVWDAYIILRVYFGGGRDTVVDSPATEPVLALAGFSVGKVEFVTLGKSPFLPYKEAPKPVVKVAQKTTPPMHRALAKPKEEIKPPNISINGIMWNPTSPLAILNLPDGTSSVVKPGQAIGGFTVKKIEQGRVLVVVEKREFWVGK